MSSLLLVILLGLTFVISSAEEPTVHTEGDWKYITLAGNNARIIDYTGLNPVEVTVPGTLGGFTVTEMGGLDQWNGVFDYKSTLTKVTLPNSIKEIGRCSFFKCSGLMEINLPDKLETIGYYAFSMCTSLPNLTFPNTVSSFGQNAFSGCKFTEFTVPPLVTEIPEGLLAGNSTLPQINLPYGIRSIGKWAFSSCTALPGITIPNSVTEIGEQAFRSCTFVDIVLPNNLTIISSGMFEYCSKLQNVTIPGSVKTIGSDAFFNCTSLKEITLPEGVQEIASTAFKSCEKLDLVSLPSTLKTIGDEAFRDCTSLKNITFPTGVSIKRCAFKSSGLTAVTIPSGVELVGAVFEDCQALQQVTLQPGMQSSGTGNFFKCTGLKSLSIPAGVDLGENMFSNCLALEQVTFQPGLTAISEGCFYRCTALKDVVLPAGVIIKTNAFVSSGLTSINIPADAVLGKGAFSYCAALQQVTLQPGSGGQIVSEDCFYGCNALTNITLPAGLSIQEEAFAKTGLTSISIPADTALSRAVFKDCLSLAQVTLQPGLQSISKDCFKGCMALKGVDLPAGIEIQESAFSYTGLMSLIIPADAELGYAAFSYCPYLQQVTLQPGLKALSTNCFMGAKSLNSIAIPGSVKVIPSGAFAGCGLTQVNLEDGVTSIQSNAFPGCAYLHMIRIPRSVTYIAPGGTEDGSGPFAMSKMTVIYGYLNSVAHLAAHKYSIHFIDLESGEQNPLPTIIITSTQDNTIGYLGNIMLEANLDGVIWSADNISVKLVPNGNKVTVYSVKNFAKTGTVTITATLGDITANYEIKIKPNFLQWLQIIFLFGWIWM